MKTIKNEELPNRYSRIISIDVESIGLLGQHFAVGGVYFVDGEETGRFRFACDPDLATGRRDDRAWVAENIPPIEINCSHPPEVSEKFWLEWRTAESEGFTMACDCPFPVEAKFLIDCLEGSEFKTSPYPLIDIASTIKALGGDPLANFPRNANEPKHDPVGDARQSGRILFEYLTANAHAVANPHAMTERRP